LLLPGMSTITTRSRYLSMLCAALANAERNRPFLPGASGLAQRRKEIEPFERLWALACVAAYKEGNGLAADGLRGVRRAEKTYHDFLANGRDVNCNFKLLKYQSRTGAVGTYWTALVSGQLVQPDSGCLADEGYELAEEFPVPPLDARDLKQLADSEKAHRVSLPLDELMAWSEQCHLQAARRNERQKLGEALTADDRREYISRALAMMERIPDNWDIPAMKRLGKLLDGIPRAQQLGLPIVVIAIVVTEQFHEAVLTVFNTLLWWGTERASQPVANLMAEVDFSTASTRCKETAQTLLDFRSRCEHMDVRDAIEGLATFCHYVVRCDSPRDVVSQLLDRHHDVQSGKKHGEMSKLDWISWDNTRLLRPSPRFQRSERPSLATGRSLTHPYRLEPFVHMLRENDVLPRNANGIRQRT
jgi:hypothetical protein